MQNCREKKPVHLVSLQQEGRLNSDFWWLPESLKGINFRGRFGHHAPFGYDHQPSPSDWHTQECSIGEIVDLARKFCGANVYRSLEIVDKDNRIIGPLVIDIDNDVGNLGDTLAVARKTQTILQDLFGVIGDTVKVFFTGHKGFNFEIRPQALDIPIDDSVTNQVVKSAKLLSRITNALRRGQSWTPTNQVSDAGTIVDQIYGNKFGYKLKHSYVRLHGSSNVWLAADGMKVARAKVELAPEELRTMPVPEILKRSRMPSV